MANEIYIPKLNPINFRRVNPNRATKYFSQPFEDFRFHETLQPWEQRSYYKQKFTYEDTTRLQMTSNFTDVKIRIVDCRGFKRLEYAAAKVRDNISMPNYGIYEVLIFWAQLSPNETYFVQIFLGDVLYLHSEPIEVTVTLPGSLLFEYDNPRYHGRIVFETGWRGAFRVEGYIGLIDGGSDDSLFTETDQENIMLSSTPFDAFPLYIGPPDGNPSWVIQKMYWIWSCRNVYIDGIKYSKDAEGGFSYTEEKLHARKGMNMKIREGSNDNSLMVAPNFDEELDFTLVGNIRVSVFGPMPNNSDDTIGIILSDD